MYPSRPSLAFALLPDEEKAHDTRDKYERIPGVSRRFRRAFGGKKTIGAVWSIVFVCLTWWGVTKNLERMKPYVSHPHSLESPDSKSDYLADPTSPWSPRVIRRCDKTVNPDSAACTVARVAWRGGLYGEDLEYPDFRIRLPLFADDKTERDWVELVKEIEGRAVMEDGYLVYRNQVGENYVVENATFNGGFDTWQAESCMGGNPTLMSALQIERPSRNDSASIARIEDALESIVVVNSPDSWSFQHFLDRVTHIVGQATHLMPTDEDGRYQSVAVTGRTPETSVQQLWEILGFDDDHVMHYPTEPVTAKRVFWSCKAVLVHPWLSKMAADTLSPHRLNTTSTRNKVSVPSGDSTVEHPSPEAEGVSPTSDQVVYVSRSHGGALNGGREVVNEEEVLHAIRSFLEQRGRGEELVEYHTLTFDSFADKAKFFATESLAIVGPHGGGLMNHRFMSEDSMVVEFMPTSFKRVAHYEDISTLGQTYGSIVVDPAEGSVNDMEIDPAKVISLLDRNLGKKSDTVILDRL